MRLLPLLSTLLLGSALATSLPLSVGVGNICEVAARSSQAITLRCTASTPAPLDPREYSGVLPGHWHLIQSERDAQGAQLYRYQLVSSATDLHFD
ncbi:hypothetical protein [Deinococcus fonticola]|uniref:hypothetical protein n=1 Tax=Deinococcus fonticola TaxID=2528713 RepID=UPI001074C430|nr:hypothetical protein [Deinococcus fonticola]